MTHESPDGVVGFSLRPLSAIVAGGSIALLRYPEISVWSIGVFPKLYTCAKRIVRVRVKAGVGLGLGLVERPRGRPEVSTFSVVTVTMRVRLRVREGEGQSQDQREG